MAAATSLVIDEKTSRDLVKELAEAVSTQAQVTNRTWLALITVALFALVPRASTTGGNISLPFNLGDVSPIWFHGLVLSLLAILSVAFASAHSQQVRAQKLAHSFIDSLVASDTVSGLIHPRDYFDMMRKPSLNRIASLAQSLRGKYQFFSSNQRLPRWLQLLTVIYYGLLKVMSFVVYFLLPLWALWQAYRSFPASGPLRVAAMVGVSIAGIALAQVLLLDLAYASNILKLLSKRISKKS
jgi:hypothetical protein